VRLLIETWSQQGLWERACPANTGEARAILRAACFAGQARSHKERHSPMNKGKI
jgi:hypothetical protein